ncbi:Sulfite reductase [NADPH] flavoprotein alpha-component [hydrothermal vent metagenome]|uniref:Sulfite reductase [NADPH] flavoprotein alpha-component n=2 Tax=hydrothermal vent metagenome TaxID=652676 RepID=A0A3B0WWZ7_9ZZZZ
MIINEAQQKLLEATKQNATTEQLIWLSGYFYGLANEQGGLAQLSGSTALAPKSLPNVTILYASETGNAAGVAQQLHDVLSAQGVPVTLSNVLDYRIKSLKKETHVIMVASTYGDGEAPDEALAFYNSFMSDKAPKLEHLSFAVFGLGDSSYDLFCQTGIDFDKRFAELGATRLLDRVDGDVEFEDDAKAWIDALSATLIESSIQATETDASTTTASTQNWSESQPFAGEVLNIIDLTDDGSDKNVWHLEIGLDESGIHYQPGDIVALLPKNDPELVAQLIEATGLSTDDSVTIKETSYTLKEALTQKCDITSLNKKWVEHYAEQTGQSDLDVTASDIQKIIEDGDILDLIQAKPATLNAQSLIDLLRPLRSRQYSIASSQAVYDDEVHVTVKQVEYTSLNRPRKGVCSNWLAGLTEGDTVPLYIKTNNSFKLPENSNAKIIMVGAGTGVAPFRSFLQQRDADGLKGNTWLFFGEQHFRTDFLYQLEWQKYIKSGVLENISLAFSRDQAEKIYVQNRLVEQAQEVFKWLEDGAYLYVCGDRNHMAKDVHNAFITVISKQGQKTPEEAEAYLQDLISQRRYQRDVY